ncbi:MAG: biotin/lipoyl-binding protein [Planctomycetes bacterium]|nr:biotin/lipoyl-binding protein [Planctomycetota bacterium]HPF14189.1 biotin/lipoyl-binding protein [Planctomycetota bacterium]HRV81390.1 biotin/lipoyl-binding protein [Planctomycetota bacterium]
MKLFVQVDGREFEVELSHVAGKRVMLIDGEPMEVDYRAADALGQVILMHAGKSYGISIEGTTHQVHATLAGHAYALHMEDERERAASLAAKAALGGGGPLEAVMPGIVVEVLVQEGQQVEAGQPILILEAMKMQNEILAVAPAVVASVHVKAGDTVPAGAVLVVLRGLES